MCCPISSSYADKIVHFFKAFEWVFWVCIVWLSVNLMFTKFFFNKCLGSINWLIKQQGLDGTVTGSDKAMRQFRRDLWILIGLKALVIILIRLL